MNIVVEKQPKCIAILNVEVPSADVAAKRANISSTYASQAKIAGFRPGKAPKSVIQKRFGKQISEELTEALFGEACDQALDKEDLKVLDFGSPENLNERPDGSIVFEVTWSRASLLIASGRSQSAAGILRRTWRCQRLHP